MAEADMQLHRDPVEILRLPSGVELACRVVGDGPIPLVFIHGYTMSLDSWERVLDLLPEDFIAYAYDLRGFGRSGEAGSYTLEDHAADLLALMDRIALDRAALIGHSLGANIGQMTLAGAPERVSAFVMCNGPARNLPHPDPVAGKVEERIAAYGTVEDNRRVLSERMGLYFDADTLTAEEMRRFIEIGARAKTEALRQTLRGLYSHPTLVLQLRLI